MAENLQRVPTLRPLFGHPLCLVSVLPFTHTGCSFRLVLPFFGLTCKSHSSSLWLESGSCFFFCFYFKYLDRSFTVSCYTLSCSLAIFLSIILLYDIVLLESSLLKGAPLNKLSNHSSLSKIFKKTKHYDPVKKNVKVLNLN